MGQFCGKVLERFGDALPFGFLNEKKKKDKRIYLNYNSPRVLKRYSHKDIYCHRFRYLCMHQWYMPVFVCKTHRCHLFLIAT